jgi:hypothetical protein
MVLRKSLFPVRCGPQAGLRTRPQGGTLDVPRPDAFNPTGTHSGSHLKGRSNAADGIAVDRASVLIGFELRVGKWI